ncbi:hypothetical protein [Terrabacter sp. Ter38]|uniref:hypothetical protein n=1 Tax=Terrabacter sp. Ter38 TaxID=2926030 RepID=UPI0021179158|nr:hypothetical protein [Terrabacter sp. Ter38]
MRYEFILAEQIPEVARAAFPELDESTVPVGALGSVMYGHVVDAPHLHGILDRFQDLGFTLLELRRLPD